MPLVDEGRSAWRSEQRDHRVALIAILAVGLAVRLLHLGQPMRYDESVTWVEFARYPLVDALSRYTYPSNHLFHTLLVKLGVAVFGNAPWVVRLPAFVAGMAIVPATYAVARAAYGGRPALIAAALVASSGVLTLYATSARGYSLVGLMFLLLLLVAMRLERRPSARGWIALAVIGAVGLWTIPVMLYPLGVAACWLALSCAVAGRRRDLWILAASLAGTALLTAACYAPVFLHSGLAPLVRNRFVMSSPWIPFLGELRDSAGETLRSWGLGLPPIVSVALLLFALRALLRHAALTRLRVGLPLAAFVWSAWLLVVTHRAPQPRVWLWALPLAAALAGAGLVTTLREWQWTRTFIERRSPLLAVLLVMGLSASVTLSHAVFTTLDTGTFADAEAAAAVLRGTLRDGDRVIAPKPSNGPLLYWFDRLGVDPAVMTLEESQARRLFVIVNEAEGQSLASILASTVARDPTRFTGAIVAELPRSTIVSFERRDASPR